MTRSYYKQALPGAIIEIISEEDAQDDEMRSKTETEHSQMQQSLENEMFERLL